MLFLRKTPNTATKLDLKVQTINGKSSQEEDANGGVPVAGEGAPRRES